MKVCIVKVLLTLFVAIGTLSTSVNGVEKKTSGKDIQLKDLTFQFKKPVRIKAGGKVVSVESPGYACPTMADVDGDGKPDLVVGQFRNGNMQFCKNVAAPGQDPEFASAEWLKVGDDRLEVPGVW